MAVLLVIALALVPITIAWSHVELDSRAFADSTRSAFSELNDPSAGSDVAESTPPAITADYTSHVDAKMQNSIMTGGCEIVSLGIAMESMGIEADLDRIVEEFLDIDGHFATGYSGDPYSQGAGFPPGIVAAANGYLESIGSQVRAYNLTDASFDELRSLVAQGFPVLVWSTMRLDDPSFDGAYDHGFEWYSNEHCVVLYGFDGQDALVSDPLEGLVSRDAQRFADIYEQCGNMAVVLY